jgi:hypothetical protein
VMISGVYAQWGDRAAALASLAKAERLKDPQLQVLKQYWALAPIKTAALGRISPRLLSRTSPCWLHDSARNSAQALAHRQVREQRDPRQHVTQQ